MNREEEFSLFLHGIRARKDLDIFFTDEFERSLKTEALIGKNKLRRMYLFLLRHSNSAYEGCIHDIDYYTPELAGCEDVVFFKAIIRKDAPLATDLDKRLEYEDYIYQKLEENFPPEILSRMVFQTEVEHES